MDSYDIEAVIWFNARNIEDSQRQAERLREFLKSATIEGVSFDEIFYPMDEREEGDEDEG